MAAPLQCPSAGRPAAPGAAQLPAAPSDWPSGCWRAVPTCAACPPRPLRTPAHIKGNISLGKAALGALLSSPTDAYQRLMRLVDFYVAGFILSEDTCSTIAHTTPMHAIICVADLVRQKMGRNGLKEGHGSADKRHAKHSRSERAPL